MRKLVTCFALGMAVFFTSCVEEDKEKVCKMIAASNTINLKITSENPLPENLQVSINGQSQFADECSNVGSGAIAVSDDRKTAYLTYWVAYSAQDQDQYFNEANEPVDEYMDVTVRSRVACGAARKLEQEKLNVFINWKSSDELVGGCTKSVYQGLSQFTFGL